MQNVALMFDTEHRVFAIGLRLKQRGRIASVRATGKRIVIVARSRQHRGTSKTILIASRDSALLQWKKQVLKGAGYAVITAASVEQVSRKCRRQKIDLLLLGSSLSPAEKRRFWVEARNMCQSPVLELYGRGDPELMDEIRTHAQAISPTASDLVDAVRTILDQE